MIKWNRSEGGFCRSKCGRFSIEPIYCGRVNPVGYELFDREAPADCFNGTKVAGSVGSTHKRLKEIAERIVRRERNEVTA